MYNKILDDVLEYYARTDMSQIDHTLKVTYLTRRIAEKEGYSKQAADILETSALLHDIGCPNSKLKYGNTLPANQEKEGMIVAKEILSDEKYSDIDSEIKERIIKIVGGHHQKNKAIELKFMPLFEADAIINMTEGYFKNVDIARRLLKSHTSLQIFDKIYQ